jgi:hypothetical protein
MLKELPGTKILGELTSPATLLQKTPFKSHSLNLSSAGLEAPFVFQATKIWEVSSVKPVKLLMVILIVLPEICSGPFDKLKAEHMMGVGVAVGVLVAVGVFVGVGVSLGVGVIVGVFVGVNVYIGVGVSVGVFEAVGVSVGVLVGVLAGVGVLASQVDGGAVTCTDTVTMTVRELSAVMVKGSNGTSGTMGVYCASTKTLTLSPFWSTSPVIAAKVGHSFATVGSVFIPLIEFILPGLLESGRS